MLHIIISHTSSLSYFFYTLTDTMFILTCVMRNAMETMRWRCEMSLAQHPSSLVAKKRYITTLIDFYARLMSKIFWPTPYSLIEICRQAKSSHNTKNNETKEEKHNKWESFVSHFFTDMQILRNNPDNKIVHLFESLRCALCVTYMSRACSSSFSLLRCDFVTCSIISCVRSVSMEN